MQNKIIDKFHQKYLVISNKYRNFALAFEKESNVGAIAQLVEQRTENPCVPGSIPGGTTQKRLRIFEVFFAFIPFVFCSPFSSITTRLALP